MSAGSLDLWIDLMPDSPFGDILTARSVLVQPVKPSKAHRVSPLEPVGDTDRRSKTIIATTAGKSLSLDNREKRRILLSILQRRDAKDSE